MRRILLILAVIVAVAATAVPSAGARLLPRDAKLMGMTYQHWDVFWGIQSLKRSIQAETSLLAVRGNKCGFQYGKAWLLPAQIVPGTLRFRCTIPAGTFLVLPVAGYFEVGLPPKKMRARVLAGFEHVKDVSLIVDGRRLARPGHIVRTPIFTADVPVKNGLGLPPGTISAMSKDYFAILSPLPRGAHEIRTSATFDTDFGASIFRLTVR